MWALKTCTRTGTCPAWACVLVVTAALGGCSGSPTNAKSQPERSVSSPSGDADGKPHAEALAAYRSMWDDLDAAAGTSDPKHPRLDDHAAEGALELLRYMMRQDRKDGVITMGRLRIAPVVKRGAVSKVVIRDCADSTDWLHYTRDGELEDDIPGGHHRVDSTVGERKGVWRVERMYIDQVGTC